jgi:transcriptional regulator with XRE-family HTH domain
MKRNGTVKISKVLAHNLVVLREKHKLSVIDVAKRCNVTRQAIYQVESGDRWISLPLIEALCKTYKIEEHELFQINTTLK